MKYSYNTTGYLDKEGVVHLTSGHYPHHGEEVTPVTIEYVPFNDYGDGTLTPLPVCLIQETSKNGGSEIIELIPKNMCS